MSGWKFQTFKAGKVGGEHTEKLLPTGVTQKTDKNNAVQTNRKEEKLLPLHVKPKKRNKGTSGTEKLLPTSH